jgi:hypothetical protein
VNTTPKAITPEVLALCKRLDESQEPVFVPVQPVAGAIINECFPNVENHVKKHGGSIQYGWIIWEHPRVIIEGNFHACWVDTAGQLVDITPKQDREQTILFLPDTKRVYDGTPVDNVREFITKDPAILKTLKMQEDLNKLRVKYNVNGVRSEIPVHELERIGFPVPEGNGDMILDMTGRTPARAKSGKVGRNDLCPCGSGIKFKKCCGK